MLVALLLLATAAFYLYRQYADANKKWKRRGLPGPEPEFFWGNLRHIWDYERPRSLVLRDWTEKYGKIYGFFEGQRPHIVVSDFETIEQIIVKKFDHFSARARMILAERNDGPNTRIIDARGNHWKRLRAVGSKAFTTTSMRNSMCTVVHSAEFLVEEMARHQGEIDVLEFFQEYTLDVICKLALGMSDVKMFDNYYLQDCKATFSRPLRHFIYAFPALFPSWVDEYKQVLSYLSKKGISSPFITLLNMVRHNVEERKAQRAAGVAVKGDFIDIFLDAEVDVSEVAFGEQSDTARKLSSEEIEGLCVVFLMAGFDTTANSLAYTTYFLANHGAVQQKLIEEVDSFLAENETMELEQLNKQLPYMEAVIKETLRHYPLGSTAVTRECVRACEIGGFQFEVGDMIATDTWTMHMDETVWGTDAKEFRPERWLEESSRPRCAFQAFGEGPRVCLGMKLAYLEEKFALIKILSRFTIEKTANTNPLHLVGSMTVSPGKVMVKLVKR